MVNDIQTKENGALDYGYNVGQDGKCHLFERDCNYRSLRHLQLSFGEISQPLCRLRITHPAQM
jgi:hypothetical protein